MPHSWRRLDFADDIVNNNQEPHCRHVPALTKFDGGLNLLHKADDDAVMWLESTATAVLVK